MPIAAAYGSQYVATSRELDGVADQIDEHLAEVRSASDKLARRLDGICQQKIDALIRGLGRQQVVHFLDNAAKVEGDTSSM